MMTHYTIPDKKELQETRQRLALIVHRTPVLTSDLLNKLSGAMLYFKCENFQRAGAFKFRGALNAVMQLSPSARQHGVATHSSGNHAQALALAANLHGLKAYIVMPNNAPSVKKAATAGYGGQITECEPTLQAREATLQDIIKETGAMLVHPYDNHQVICGQSTATQELLEQVSNLQAIVAPVGGGGLLSGTALAAKYADSQIAVYGAEPAGAADALASFRSGKLVPSVNPQTIADGLLTSLSSRTLQIIRHYADDILTVTDDQIQQAMRLLWERLKVVVEPSAAVTLAVVLANPQIFEGKKVGLILSGGNVDVGRMLARL